MSSDSVRIVLIPNALIVFHWFEPFGTVRLHEAG
jgi:hypothetical protein